MAVIRKQPDRKYPSLPSPGLDVGQHRVFLELVKEALEIHERRTGNVRDSFVRVGDLADLGIIREVSGTILQGRSNLQTFRAQWVSSSALTASVDPVPVLIPFDATILSVAVVANGGTGSCELDISRGTVGDYPPSNSIVASAPPAISSGDSYFDAKLDGWDKKVFKDDVLLFDISSTSTFTSIFAFVTVAEAPRYEL